MREAAKFLIWAGLIFFLPAVLPAVELTVRIPPAEAVVGTVVRVPIVLENAADLGAVEIDLEYPPNILEFINLEPGGLNPGMVEFKIVQPGLLRIGSISEPALNGNGDLFLISFKVLGPGTASLDFRKVKASEGASGAEIPTTSKAGAITAQSAAAPAAGGGGLAIPPQNRLMNWILVVEAVVGIGVLGLLVVIVMVLRRIVVVLQKKH